MNCQKIDEAALQRSVKSEILKHLKTEQNQIEQLNVSCPSVIVIVSFMSKNQTALERIIDRLSRQLMRCKISITPNGKNVIAVNGKMLDCLTSTTRMPTEKFLPLVINWKPIFITMGAVGALIILFICCSCVLHSYWLSKNKFTKYNSTPIRELKRKRRKQQLKERRAKMEEDKGCTGFYVSMGVI